MYRILVADDESIVRESLKFIIESRYGGNCELELAKTGRGAIEKAESLRPDIVFMDIQMPGINGIEAMKEIRKQNSSAIFIVLTAFDKFDYAKESIGVGVLEYMSKPVSRDEIESILSKAMGIIDRRREIRNQDLSIKEKLETVIPYIERGLIYTMLINEDNTDAIGKYKELLGISSEYGYVLVAEAFEQNNRSDANPVGSGICLEDHYDLIKGNIMNEFYCLVGPVMTNRIVVIVPYETAAMDYDSRTHLVDKVRNMLHRLEKLINADIKISIGNVKSFDKLQESYQEAKAAMNIGIGSVLHAADLKIGCSYEEDYPIEIEHKIFEYVERGDVDSLAAECTVFWNWMVSRHADAPDDIKIKILDIVLRAEHLAYEKANMYYQFASRTDYLGFISSCNDTMKLKIWFIDKLSKCTENISRVIEETNKTPVEKALGYINEKYYEDISLEQMSQIVGISSYYFSKLFKSEIGVNFIDYLTDLRIGKAKELLKQGEISVKDIGSRVGYSDANYFSRIFKKNVGVSPSEYK